MQYITAEKARELRAEDTAMLLVITLIDHKQVALLAELENNENTDEEDYTPARINEYYWELDTSSGLNLAGEINHQCETRAGGIYIYNTEDPFGALELYADNKPITYLRVSDEASIDVFEELPDGYYMVVFGSPDTLYR